MILADQCVYEATIRGLEEQGFTVTRLRSIARPDLPDAEVLELAKSRNEILLTVDKDFSNVLVYPPAQTAGIVVLRGSANDEDAVRRVLIALLESRSEDELRGRLIIVDRSKYRIRSA